MDFGHLSRELERALDVGKRWQAMDTESDGARMGRDGMNDGCWRRELVIDVEAEQD